MQIILPQIEQKVKTNIAEITIERLGNTKYKEPNVVMIHVIFTKQKQWNKSKGKFFIWNFM